MDNESRLPGPDAASEATQAALGWLDGSTRGTAGADGNNEIHLPGPDARSEATQRALGWLDGSTHADIRPN